jgi:hypothetical protein
VLFASPGNALSGARTRGRPRWRHINGMASQATFLPVQFLDWVARRPRTLADVRDAWQSTCPLNSAWEDAIADDLVAFGPEGHVVLTARGRARLGDA